MNAVARHAAPSDTNARPVWLSLGFILVLLALLLGAIGVTVYASARRSVTEGAHRNLESIAAIKVNQIERWLAHRRDETEMVLNGPLFARELSAWMGEGMPDSPRRASLLEHMRSASAHFGQFSIHAAADGALLLSSDPASIDSAAVRQTAKAAAARGLVLDDTRIPAAGVPAGNLALYFPVGPGSVPRPAIVAHLEPDANASLWSELGRWPGSSPSAETLLFRIDGSEVVFVSQPRSPDNAPLGMRYSVRTPGLLAAQVAHGSLGALSGVDYRGVSVLGYVQPVGSTPWYLVAKVAEDEVLADIDRLARLTTVALLGLLGLLAWWRSESHRQRKARYRLDFERTLLSQRMEFISDHANDAILLADTAGRIIEANELCSVAYGYTRAELIGMPVSELWAPAHATDAAAVPTPPLPADEAFYETEHRRKDGLPLAVEVSSRMIDIDGVRYFQAIVRDNRQRKQYEMSLRQSEERFRLTFDHAPIGMLMIGLDGRILGANDACCRISGWSRDELLAMGISDATRPEDRAAEAGWLDDLLASEDGHCAVEKRIVRKDGEIVHLRVHRSLVCDAEGKPRHVVSQIRDITRQKEADLRIERLSRLKAALSRINHAIVHSRTPEEVFAAVCRACVDDGGFRLAWVGVVAPTTQEVTPAFVYGPAAGYMDGLAVSTNVDLPEGRCPNGLVAAGRRKYLCNDLASEPLFEPWRERAARHGLASLISVSLQRGGQPYGLLGAYGAGKNAFDDESVELLEAMAQNVSFALDQFDVEAQRRQAADDLRRSEHKARNYALKMEDLYQNAPCGYHSVDCDGGICRINDTELAWLGYTREEVVGCLRFPDLMTADTRHGFVEHFEKLKRTGQVNDLELQLLRKDGSSFPVLLSASAIYDRDGRYVASRSTVHDITRVKVLEDERARQAAHLLRLSHRLVAVQEEERRQLAGALQDRAAPNLAAAKLTMATLSESLRGLLPVEDVFAIEDVGALLDDTVNAVRDICDELRPGVLDYAGLIPALAAYSQQYTRRTGIAVALDMPPEDMRFGAEIETTLFRILQEALINAAQHGAASSVEIAIVAGAHYTVLTVNDNGLGFDVVEALSGGMATASGLLTMRERAEFVGGTLDIESYPGQGTRVRVELRARGDISDSPRNRLPGANVGAASDPKILQ